ncbi:hypothetical protein BDK92_7185 [Micromonospora pisi]|uniref:Uncharacterized protein n=1 Tax=Micromonospora pisi TaxID=589240 RepID=A0A495JUL1_9ACTN|nr:hypothetical protein [Micromonospora pisi]RKR92707.1 hypothetical protein BDK92_7185 [Micromonospora pisi]
MLTLVELAMVAQAAEDYAACWYGPQPAAVFSRWDCERYVSEGYLKHLHHRYNLDELMAAVGAHLDANPNILTAGRVSAAELVARETERHKRAEAVLDQALIAFRAGRRAEGLRLIDAAEVEAPLMRDYDRLRARVNATKS